MQSDSLSGSIDLLLTELACFTLKPAFPSSLRLTVLCTRSTGHAWTSRTKMTAIAHTPSRSSLIAAGQSLSPLTPSFSPTTFGGLHIQTGIEVSFELDLLDHKLEPDFQLDPIAERSISA
jgi:hypothetical protein